MVGRILTLRDNEWVPILGGGNRIPVPVEPEPVTSWAGDPGDGEFIVGFCLGPMGRNSITEIRNAPGYQGDAKNSVIHGYSSNGNGVDQTLVNNAIAAGFIPSQSCKFSNFTPAQIVAGDADAAIDASAAFCASKAPVPILLDYYHEPEDNFDPPNTSTGLPQNTAGQQAFRAAGRRIAMRFRAAGVTNVSFGPIYMNPYTFDSSSKRDWRNWHPDWQANGGWHDELSQDWLGLDTYNPLPPNADPNSSGYVPWTSGGRQNRPFATMMDNARAKIELAGYPLWDYVLCEFGMSYGATVPTVPDWLDWAQKAATYAKANRVKGFFYWDSSLDPHRYSFTPEGDPDMGFGAGRKLQGWNHIVSQSIKKVA